MILSERFLQVQSIFALERSFFTSTWKIRRSATARWIESSSLKILELWVSKFKGFIFMESSYTDRLFTQTISKLSRSCRINFSSKSILGKNNLKSLTHSASFASSRSSSSNSSFSTLCWLFSDIVRTSSDWRRQPEIWKNRENPKKKLRKGRKPRDAVAQVGGRG